MVSPHTAVGVDDFLRTETQTQTEKTAKMAKKGNSTAVAIKKGRAFGRSNWTAEGSRGSNQHVLLEPV
jgi:hypothetical protein